MISTVSAISQVFSIVAGIGWEPEIRGALTIVLAVAVLMGSVWGILVTNTGVRLGSLISIAAFFGWMFIMGIIWWIYGIGYAGSLPSFHAAEFNVDPAGVETVGNVDAVTGNVGDLPDTNCETSSTPFPPTTAELASARVSVDSGCAPRAIDLLLAFDGPTRELVIQDILNPTEPQNRMTAIIDDGMSNPDEQLVELIARAETELIAGVEAKNATIDPGDPRFLDQAGIDESVEELRVRRNLRLNSMTLSALDAVAPEITEWADDEGYLQTNGWNLLSTAESGEAVAAAQAELEEADVFEGREFIVLDAWQQGGKPLLANADTANWFDKAVHRVRDALRITNPTNYTVIQTQVALEKPALPGELPPVPEIEDGAGTVSVVLIRDLGNLRLVPALVTIISLLFFLASCLALHFRDLRLRGDIVGDVRGGYSAA